MLGRYWRAVAVSALVVAGLAAIIAVFGRFPPATAKPPAIPGPPESFLPTPAPMSTMVPQAWIPEPVGAPPASTNPYTVPDYARTYPTGFGLPHAASLAEISAQPGCNPATSKPDPYGPCGWGAFIRCEDNPWTPACNQRLSDGMTCGFGLRDCIEARLACRLPMMGGFLTFPKGDYRLDPNSETIPQRGPAHHAGAFTYDWAYARWVPTPMALIAPDGRHYAVLDQDWAVHDVGVTDGSDRVVSPSGRWFPLAYTQAGIYAVPVNRDTYIDAGLWLLQQRPRRITQTGYWSMVGGGAAYGHSSTNATLSGDTMLRLDLSSGTSTPWFRRPAEYVDVIGFDRAGHPIVMAFGGQVDDVSDFREVWLVTGRNAGINLVSGMAFVPASMTDAHGTWLWSNQGLYLLTVVTDSAGIPHPVIARVASQKAQGPVGVCT